MTGADLDVLFREAVAAIDAGDVAALERLLQEHPELVRDRLTDPGDWVRSQIGPALDGFFEIHTCSGSSPRMRFVRDSCRPASGHRADHHRSSEAGRSLGLAASA